MASSSSSSKDSPEENTPTVVSPEEVRNWLELPHDVTASILSRLGSIDILVNAQKVCSLWFNICKDPLMWRTIDMRNDDSLAGLIDLEKMCRHAVDRSSGQLFDITLEHFGDDDLITYIASSSSRIKHLRLACCYHISDEGLVKALAKLPLLEELELTRCSFSVEPLEAVGQFCRNLKSLKLNYQMYRSFSIQPDEEAEYNEEANAIAKNMPALCHLQLIGNCMTNMGLQAILDGCPHLESLDLRRCLHLNLKEGLGKKCSERIKFLKLPDESTEGSRFDFGESTDGSRSYEYEDYLSGLSADDYADDYLENYVGDDYLGVGDDYLGFDDYFDDFMVLPFDDWLDF